MALLQVNYVSQALMHQVALNVILPVDEFASESSPYRPERKFPTLYLLHGLLGNYGDWVTGTRVKRWAETHGLAVVMPSGDNHFYVDQPATHELYGHFIGCELVEMTRRMFPLSRRREDTFIGRLSMGGYGALRNGLKYADTFSHIAALSTANIVTRMDFFSDDAPNFNQRTAYLEALFGPRGGIPGSDNDLSALARGLKGSPRKPKLYLACGDQDSLLPLNLQLKQELEADGFDLTWRQAPGGHEWDFWDSQIRQVIDWLPLAEDASGMNSGNVGR